MGKTGVAVLRGGGNVQVLTDSIPGIRVIKTFSGGERSIRKFGRHVDEIYKVDLEVARKHNRVRYSG